ncbi:MAG: D-tyrosyl-tRNA(Tyr) deacylase [Chlorobiaceae bacterium]|nr:D-tyrosyl-tRNA(Tyr) deacylase [Chlorobiaceae bacterium]
MRVVVQRAGQASVSIGGTLHSEIGAGLLLFVGIGRDDSDQELAWMTRKIINLRIFEDQAGKMNLSVKEVGGSMLAVSQFTLYADVSRGNRPGFSEAASPETATILFDRLVDLLRESSGCKVETGIFGADMQVSLLNDGPVTIILESPQRC